MIFNLAQKTEKIRGDLSANSRLSHFVDFQLPTPKAYYGTAKIQLFVLGQDPTIKNEKSRATIETVLNLDKLGSLHTYLSRICTRLGFDLENVYATNYLKNFFASPPTKIKEINVFREFAPYWLPLLKEELSQFPEVSVITLGQPLLSAIVIEEASPCVRDYWGYVPNWKLGEKGTYRYLEPDKNILGRAIFPFPHQPSIEKKFYAERFESYIRFMKQQIDIKSHTDKYKEGQNG